MISGPNPAAEFVCAACFFRQMISANDFGIICRNHLPRAHPSPGADGQMVSANNSEIICRNHLPRTRAQKLILGSIKSGPASGLFFQNFPAPAAGFVFSKFVGACGGLCFFSAPAAAFFCFQKFSAPAAGFVLFFSAPAAGSCLSFVS